MMSTTEGELDVEVSHELEDGEVRQTYRLNISGSLRYIFMHHIKSVFDYYIYKCVCLFFYKLVDNIYVILITESNINCIFFS